MRTGTSAPVSAPRLFGAALCCQASSGRSDFFERSRMVPRLHCLPVFDMTISLSIIQFACFVIFAVLLASGIRYLLLRPTKWESGPTNLLVLIAHPDDCVVLAGEYALWVLGHGMSVRIVYFTSGSDDPVSSRAKMREGEALAAWRSVGVPEANLHFLRYRQSPMNGTCALSRSDLEQATAKIGDIVLAVEPGTAVFVPAAGEIHSDHREIRRIGLKAIGDSGRGDLLMLEAPEYNSSLSLARSPGKVVQYFLKSLPLVWRLGGDTGSSPFPGFIRGDRAYMICDEAIISRKKAMLRQFISEDGEKLVRHFGFQNQFRPVKLPVSAHDEKFGLSYLHFGRYRFGLSVIGLWSGIYLFAVGFCWHIPEQLAALFPASKLIFLVWGILTIFLLLASIRARKSIGSRLLYAAGIVGMIGGLIASFG